MFNKNDMKELALKIVTKAFENKTDKGGKPYIEHLKRVSAKLPDYGSGDLKMIGLLHDLLEDCPEWTEGALRCLFDDLIVDKVVILTKLKSENYEDYIERVRKDYWSALVKQADLEDNMDLTRLPEITQKDFERIMKYHKAYRIITEQI